MSDVNSSSSTGKDILKSKTFWAGVLEVGVSVASIAGLDVPQETHGVLLALMGIFLRMGVNKK